MDVELGEQEAPVGDEDATMTVAAIASTGDAGGPDAAAGTPSMTTSNAGAAGSDMSAQDATATSDAAAAEASQRNPSSDDGAQSPDAPNNDDDGTATAEAPNANNATNDSPERKFSVSYAEPPRWRFVNEARKSLGYSSHSAGTVVLGKTAEELGAVYVAPAIAQEESAETREVGDLSAPDIKYRGFGKDQEEVGRLSIDGTVGENVELFEGGCVISHDPKEGGDPEKHSRIWAHFQPRKKGSKTTKEYGKDRHTTVMESESSAKRLPKGVGKLAFDPDDYVDEPFEGEIPKRNKTGNVPADNGPAVMAVAHTVGGASATNASPEDTQELSHSDVGDGFDDQLRKDAADIEDEGDNPGRRRKRLLLLVPLLLLLVVGAVVGAVLGKERSSSPNAIVPVAVLSTNDTVMPSAYPSAEPSEGSLWRPGLSSGGLTILPNATERPSSAPSATPGDAIVESTESPSTLSPSGKPSIAPSGSPSGRPVTMSPIKQPTASPSSRPSARPVALTTQSPTIRPSSRSPSNSPVTSPPTKQPLESLGGCPEAFDPTIYYTPGTRVQSGGVVYECLSYSCGSFGFEPGVGPQWEVGWIVRGSCSGTMAPTSASPTPMPTQPPSDSPSPSPTKQPSKQPVTSPPTKQPVDFLGGCPNAFAPREYSVGSRVESQGIVYECFLAPCDTSGFAPYFSASLLASWWRVVGSCSGTLAPSRFPTKSPSRAPSGRPSNSPSEQPSRKPTLQPTPSPTPLPSKEPTSEPTSEPSRRPTPPPTSLTESPTLKPTCAENGNFNLCVAIDMSGSVCNGNSNSLCEQCEPSTPFTFNQCNSGGLNKALCCPNFSNVLEFTKGLITELGELPTQQDFSLVHFATDVTIASTLESWRQAVKSLNQFKYTGGKTNLAGAINSCQQTLASSPPDRKNLLLVITDGAPSVPESDPEDAAISAAAQAKLQDSFIIPVLIEESFGQSPELTFLENNISSDGKVFVADFDGLGSIADSLFEQVTCQANER
ncbi:hypothetical protein ACHAXT_004021 [Thalassiosira profunda]